jgi:hypothetical protein
VLNLQFSKISPADFTDFGFDIQLLTSGKKTWKQWIPGKNQKIFIFDFYPE